MGVICWMVGGAIGVKGFYGLAAGWGLLRFFLSPGAAQPKKAEARKKTTRPRLVRARLRVALRFLSGKAWAKGAVGERKKRAFRSFLLVGVKIALKYLLLCFFEKYEDWYEFLPFCLYMPF